MFRKEQYLPENELPDWQTIRSQGRALSGTWSVQSCEFLKAHQCSSEAAYKRQQIKAGKVMQHAHMGFRDHLKSERAFYEIYDRVYQTGTVIDRYGICLDWSMGYPANIRDNQMQGTGLVLSDVESFARLTNIAPVASHFGDFMLGFPAALENTRFALSAGVTTIGNLGQYFTFSLPNWKDDIATTEATLCALSLIASQPVEVLVHSNLDDGFAGVLTDLCCALGAASIERYLVEELIGAKLAHCYGHHYSTPELRYAFQSALSQINPNPGSMIYGNTTSYRGSDAENYASLAGYLAVDIAAQIHNPSGHAINPVPVTENKRIPDIEEIIDAQVFAGRMIEVTSTFAGIVDPEQVDGLVIELLDGAKTFEQNLLHGFAEAGIDTQNPVEMFLAIRRIGGKQLEQWYGPGEINPQTGIREPLIRSDTQVELDHLASQNLSDLSHYGSEKLQDTDLLLVIATTDVHEHSKMLLEKMLRELGVSVIDAGISVDADDLARIVEDHNADAIALSTYNGVALNYFGQLQDELRERGLNPRVFIGGQLNEIPEDSESSLPVDVSPELKKRGAIPCNSLADMMPGLLDLSKKKFRAN